MGFAVLLVDGDGQMELFGGPLDLYESSSEDLAVVMAQRSSSLLELLIGRLLRDNVRYLEIDTGTEGIVTAIRNRTPALVKPGNRFIEHLREVKDSEEIGLIKMSGEITRRSMKAAIESIGFGVTESEIARQAQIEMIRQGADREGFETVVGSGPRSSFAHARPTERKIGEGDLVVMDLGSMYRGYRTDMTRTIAFGKAEERMEAMLKAVSESQRAALSKIVAGANIAESVLASEEVLVRYGFREGILHGLGHGVGLDIHEEPSLVSNSEAKLKENAVVTVEPGIYFRNAGGARREDTVIVTKDGYVSVT